MRAVVLVIATSLVAGAAFAAEPYEGKWAGEAAWCKNKPSETDQVPLEITKKGIKGYESSCPFISVKKQGTAWVATAKCSGEGETWTETTKMEVDGSRLTLTYDDGTAVELVRCK